ncbi:MAG: hypothetical protein N2652_01325 [Kiritimatiellae bacterium]|nr:hypothetical protein [Kiritimatiellia bacterium]
MTSRIPRVSLTELVVTAHSAATIAPFHPHDERGEGTPPKNRPCREMERGGRTPSRATPARHRVRTDLVAPVPNHPYGVLVTRARDVVASTWHTRPCDIPSRAPGSANPRHRMMPGRCMNGDFRVHAAQGMIGKANRLGEAARAAAALAARHRGTPADVACAELGRRSRWSTRATS